MEGIPGENDSAKKLSTIKKMKDDARMNCSRRQRK